MLELLPTCDAEAIDAVKSSSGLLRIQGNSSKPAMNADLPSDATLLTTRRLTGITEYASTEFTVTVRAGTPLQELVAALDQEGQYLPFDPPGLSSGATIGGVIASGLSGPSRLRHGGARDFVIGVRFIDGSGNLVTGGGKVVKNAAGFDFPKLMVGSRGRLGLIVELTLKVFPKPEAYRTLVVQSGHVAAAAELMNRLVNRGLDLAAYETLSNGESWIRFCGPVAATERDVQHVVSALTKEHRVIGEEIGDSERSRWAEAREVNWVPQGYALIKVPLTSVKVPAMDSKLRALNALYRFSAAGNVTWIAWPPEQSLAPITGIMKELGCVGLICRLSASMRTSGETVRLGSDATGVFAKRIQRAMDMPSRFHIATT